MKRYEAAVFDLDGTLLDTLGDLNAALNSVLGQMGLRSASMEETRLRVGNGAAKLVRSSLPEGTGEAAASQALARFRAEYLAHLNERTAPYPGTVRMLERLAEKGVTAAVVTNKPEQAARELCRAHFPGLIRDVLGDREGRRRKPAPDGLLELLEKYSVPRDRALYVGDSDVDVLTARAAGVEMAWVDWGFRTREEMREQETPLRFSSARELADHILSEDRAI